MAPLYQFRRYDPDRANSRAIRAYEKAGFRSERMVDTPDGLALLMVRHQ